jgi:MFS family permease
MQLVVGVLLDRFGARVLLAGASVFCSIGLVVFAMSTTPWGLASSRFLIGFGSSFAFIGAIYVAMVWFPERQVPLLAGLTGGLGFGIGVIGELFGADMLGIPPAWRSASLILAIVGMAVAVAVLIVVPHRPAWYLDRTGIEEGRSLRRAMQGLLQVISRPSIWLISIACALIYLPLPLAANWGPRTISELLKISEHEGSRLFAWFYLGVAVGCPLAGFINSRLGRARPILLLGSLFACGITILLSQMSDPSSAGIALILLAWGGTMSAYVLGYPLAAGLSPCNAHGSAIAFVNFVAMMIAFGFVWAFGILVDTFANSRGHPGHAAKEDFQSTLLWTGIIMFIPVVILVLLRTRPSASPECEPHEGILPPST